LSAVEYERDIIKMLKQQKQKVGVEEEDDDGSRAYFNFEHSLNSP